MPHSFDAKPDSPTKKERQYYAILGNAVSVERLKASAIHAALTGTGQFRRG